MDFFSAQAHARRKSWQLTALFAAAVLALILATNLLIALVAGAVATPGRLLSLGTIIDSTPTGTWIGISFLVAFAIGIASLYKLRQLRTGGRAVAESLGGRQILPSTTDTRERRLLNVVEEMAIAAGMPVPPVYVLESEHSINAFAAGYSVGDAIIGVTHGCLEHLDRDELQGVIGHEFSHILNGDTHLNLRLVALLHGILFLGLLGEAIMRGGRRQRDRQALAFAGLGLGLWAIGYAGTFFGNLIKAAVNRQREFLADASAVQFTRNPVGVANALKKVGGAMQAPRLDTPRAREISHFFFAQAVRVSFKALMATHPPLALRIRALEPSWDGRFIAIDAPRSGSESFRGAAAAAGNETVGDAVVRQVGQISGRALPAAQARIRGLPRSAHESTLDPAAAYVLIHALFLSPDVESRPRQLAAIESNEGARVSRAVIELHADIQGCNPVERLTLIALAAPALKLLSAAQLQRLITNVQRLVVDDTRIDLTEWVMHRVLRSELAPHLVDSRARPLQRRTRAQIAAASGSLLSAIANASAGDPASRKAAFNRAAETLQARPPHRAPTSRHSQREASPTSGHTLRYDSSPDPNFARLNGSLRLLRSIHPLQKPRIVKACATCALAGGTSTEARALLAGIAATLDCPLPPDFRIDPSPPLDRG